MIDIAAKCKILSAALAILALSACGDGAAPEGEVSETVLGDIDVLEGSASDAMITVDEFDSGDNPAPAQSEADNAKAAPATEDDAAPNAENDSDAGATTIRPRNSAPAADSGDDTADTGV